MDRRTFLKIAGLGSLSVTAGCSSEAEKTLFSLVRAPDDMVTGKAAWYAATCRECPAGCGILAKNREGRVIKIEGNPLHPINRGTLCLRGQAAVQKIYHPDRIKSPLLKEGDRWRPISSSRAMALLREKAAAAAKKGTDRVRMVTEIEGESLLNLFAETLNRWRSSGPLIFEPFAYEPLKAANEAAFGLKGLVSYDIENADVLVSFGADFLDTWLSPVEYARQFKAMHAVKNGNKALFFHVSPYQSLTAANADSWFSCNPGGEAAVILGLIHEALNLGRGDALPPAVRSRLAHAVSSYTAGTAAGPSGLTPEQYRRLLSAVMESKNPLVLGTAAGACGGNAFQTNVAANLLNLILDPELKRFDFENRHRIEIAAERARVIAFFKALEQDPSELLLLNNTNPVFTLPPGSGVKRALTEKSRFVVSFGNFMDETAQLADMVFPVSLPLEAWGEYSGKPGIGATLQPAMGRLSNAPDIGEVFIEAASDGASPVPNYKAYLFESFVKQGYIRNEEDWVRTLMRGGVFQKRTNGQWNRSVPQNVSDTLDTVPGPVAKGLFFVAAPSIRFFDGRGADLPWLCEIPDPLTKIAWQTPVRMHPATMAEHGLAQGNIITIQSKWGSIEAPVYASDGVRPNVLVMDMGQGHSACGRYARGMGVDPMQLLPPQADPFSGGPEFSVHPVSVRNTGRSVRLANTDGSRFQYGRKIALSISLDDLNHGKPHVENGLTMNDFPLTLPLPEGYDPGRDFYPPHDHDGYRWGMIVDLDRCIGCAACAAACYAENNIGVVGVKRIVRGREMSWLRVERYQHPDRPEKTTFLPMLCQHCDNAPCESVCPVYAPHHSKEGLNNQIYNRCIGTRFCSQNCPYKVRRFNWFDWEWPDPLNLQLNPDVTVRSKGVMEKCSFCVQRIKAAHQIAKNENRPIRDGEVVPACVQTCPTGALLFGNLMDPESRVRKQAEDSRAYQVMGYLNTKPAVIYLKKIVRV